MAVREPTLADLVAKWLRHCKDARHVPATDGGTARYDTNAGVTRVYCCECAWRWPNPEE